MAKRRTGSGKGTRGAAGREAEEPAASSVASRSSKPPEGDEIEERRMTPIERVNRARRIAAARAKKRPDTWKQVAEREGLCERQVRRIYDDYLTWSHRRTAPQTLVDDTLDQIESLILELDSTIADAAASNNHTARVGAIRLMLEAVAGRWDVMRAAGLAPPSMARWQDAQEARAIFDAMARVLSRHEVPEAVIAELYEVAALDRGDTVESTAVDKPLAA